MGPDHLIQTPAVAYSRSETVDDGYPTLELGPGRDTRCYRRRLTADETNAGRNTESTHRFYLPATDAGLVDHLAVLETEGHRYDVTAPPEELRRPDGRLTHLELEGREVT